MTRSKPLDLERGFEVARPAAGREEDGASARSVRCIAQGWRDTHARTARENRRRFCALIAMSASSMVPRALTSTKATVRPRATTRSISPPEAEKRQASGR